MDKNFLLTGLIGTVAVTVTIVTAAWRVGEPTFALVAAIIGFGILMIIISWKAGIFTNQFVNDVGKIREATSDFDEDLDEIISDVDDIKGNTDDLYTGIIKVMQDQGIDFVEMISDSVKYNLEQSDVEAVISFGSVDMDKSSTELTIRFDEGVTTDSIIDKLVNDEALVKKETELFGDNKIEDHLSPGEPLFKSRGGGQVLEAHIPSTDDEAISEWLNILLDKIDELYSSQNTQKEEFEEALTDNLEGSEKI